MKSMKSGLMKNLEKILRSAEIKPLGSQGPAQLLWLQSANHCFWKVSEIQLLKSKLWFAINNAAQQKFRLCHTNCYHDALHVLFLSSAISIQFPALPYYYVSIWQQWKHWGCKFGVPKCVTTCRLGTMYPSSSSLLQEDFMEVSGQWGSCRMLMVAAGSRPPIGHWL